MDILAKSKPDIVVNVVAMAQAEIRRLNGSVLKDSFPHPVSAPFDSDSGKLAILRIFPRKVNGLCSLRRQEN
jgi:hypothetical protein